MSKNYCCDWGVSSYFAHEQSAPDVTCVLVTYQSFSKRCLEKNASLNNRQSNIFIHLNLAIYEWIVYKNGLFWCRQKSLKYNHSANVLLFESSQFFQPMEINPTYREEHTPPDHEQYIQFCHYIGERSTTMSTNSPECLVSVLVPIFITRANNAFISSGVVSFHFKNLEDDFSPPPCCSKYCCNSNKNSGGP